MSRVIERATGAQLLPIADGIDMLGTSWQAHCAADADLRARFPTLDVRENVRWVDRGALVTSAGISAGIDMSLHLVTRLAGAALAERTARQMDTPWNTAP